MPSGWVFLRVNGRFEVAVPQDKVFRVLHRQNEDYHAFAPSAVALHRRLGVEPDPDLPGVLVVLNSGACWYAGDASSGDDLGGLSYLSVPPDLFSSQAPWCRGLLWGGGRAIYVVSEKYLEAGVA